MWFENNSQYSSSSPLPDQIAKYPGMGLVRVYPNGRTQPGWGAKEFISSRDQGHFDPERALKFYKKHGQPFAILMRSLPMICVDIDGKNGGIQTSRVLNLPETLAERSKSGNGYHLYYRIPYTQWSELRGYDEFPDIIGLIPGVDIKGTGVVYHYPSQQWNTLDIVELPTTLSNLIGRARDARFQSRITRGGVSSLDEDEKVILHDDLRKELEGKFTAGSRNNKLFAIGSRMYAADYPEWDIALYDRGVEVGLELNEIEELIRNIQAYG